REHREEHPGLEPAVRRQKLGAAAAHDARQRKVRRCAAERQRIRRFPGSMLDNARYVDYLRNLHSLAPQPTTRPPGQALTACLSFAPALKRGALDAAIAIGSPVAGLMP